MVPWFLLTKRGGRISNISRPRHGLDPTGDQEYVWLADGTRTCVFEETRTFDIRWTIADLPFIFASPENFCLAENCELRLFSLWRQWCKTCMQATQLAYILTELYWEPFPQSVCHCCRLLQPKKTKKISKWAAIRFPLGRATGCPNSFYAWWFILRSAGRRLCRVNFSGFEGPLTFNLLEAGIALLHCLEAQIGGFAVMFVFCMSHGVSTHVRCTCTSRVYPTLGAGQVCC